MNRSALLPPLAPFKGSLGAVSHALLACSLLALALAGCFGGEDVEGDPDPKPMDTAKVEAKKIKAGFYVGDYLPYDSTRRLESEFTLNADGSCRFYWIISNEAYGDIKGAWFQRDSNLYFHTTGESFASNNGVFGPHVSVEADTNAIRDITDTSFSRKEWTLIRQKPYWVNYRKQASPGLAAGNYAYFDTTKIDDTTSLVSRVGIDLQGTGFRYGYKEDTLELFQAEATWYQVGTIFATESNRVREYVDSLKTFGEWSPLEGNLLQRIRGVSDGGFEMWSPPNLFKPGTWDTYRKQ